jgi:hypothetical protein
VPPCRHEIFDEIDEKGRQRIVFSQVLRPKVCKARLCFCCGWQAGLPACLLWVGRATAPLAWGQGIGEDSRLGFAVGRETFV